MKKKLNNRTKDLLNFIKQQLQMNFRVYWVYLRYGNDKTIIHKYISCLRFCKEIQRLIDRETPMSLKLVKEREENGIFGFNCYHCPVCDTVLSYDRKKIRFKYCPICGQRVK